MPHRAQRIRNREARELPARNAVRLEELLDFAENKLEIRRGFVAEAVRSRGLVSLTFRPRGTSNYLEVYGGEITVDGTSRLYGDTVVNNWSLPNISGFRVRYDATSAVIARVEPTFAAIDVSEYWIKESDELGKLSIAIDTRGREDGFVVTREGLTLLSQTIGHSALALGLEYIDKQLFPTHPSVLAGVS